MTRLTADVEAALPGDPQVIRVAGTLEPETAPVLHETVTGCLLTEPSIVLLDFEMVAYADESAVAGLGALADRAFAWPGAIVVVAGGPKTVSRILNATGGVSNLPQFPTFTTALSAAVGLRTLPTAPRLRLGLSPIDSAAASARRLVDRACVLWNVPALRDTARLVVTELVSNAVRHGTASRSTAVEVTLARRTGALYVSVRDCSRRLPRPGAPPPPTVEGGRGLLVVGLMSRAWGATPTTDGKVVWASLATT